MSWLLILGVFAGVGLRVLVPAGGHVAACKEACHSNDASTSEQGDGAEGHDKDCPPEPHHHHHDFCCHAGPMMADELVAIRLPVPSLFYLGLQVPQDPAPDGPVFELDKPPLI